MKKDVSEISLLFEELEKNIRFTMDRRNMHTQFIDKIIESVKNVTIFKVVIILVISALQILLIQKFFSSSKKIGLNPFYETGL